MAKLIRRTWTVRGLRGERVKRVAYGYSLMVNGHQERKVSSDWLTEADALEALAKRQREVGAGILERADRTLGEVATEYLAYKRDHGTRSLKDDERINARRVPEDVQEILGHVPGGSPRCGAGRGTGTR